VQNILNHKKMRAQEVLKHLKNEGVVFPEGGYVLKSDDEKNILEFPETISKAVAKTLFSVFGVRRISELKR